MSFKSKELFDTIAKGTESGKLGLRFNLQTIPNVLPNDDFPSGSRIRSKKTTTSNLHKNIMSQDDMERVKFKEENLDIAGFESSKVNDFAFRGKQPLKFDPFANAIGSISDSGGKNGGSLEEYENKKEPVRRQQINASAQKFIRIGKQIPIVAQPELRPPILAPEGLKVTQTPFNMRIKS
tara:strand:- start:467 stop:1006 length:540 start_codon:yes stop_codon:yes gene_type:complete